MLRHHFVVYAAAAAAVLTAAATTPPPAYDDPSVVYEYALAVEQSLRTQLGPLVPPGSTCLVTSLEDDGSDETKSTLPPRKEICSCDGGSSSMCMCMCIYA